MNMASDRWWRALPLCCAAIFLMTAIQRPVLDADEGLYLSAARTMAESGDWLTPRVNGVPFPDKPPLLYWLIAVCFRLFGNHELAARLPGIAAVAGTAWLLQRMACAAAGPLAGAIAALAFAFCAGTFLFTIEVLHDILLVFFLTLAADCGLRMLQEERATAAAVAGMGVALAGGFLSKGLIGLLFPLATIGVYLFAARSRPRLPLRPLLIVGGLFLALVAPWHLLMEIGHPGFLKQYFWNEQLLRFLSRREPMDFQSVPFFRFVALIPVWFFPWSAFLPAVIGMSCLKGLPAGVAQAHRFALCWAGVVFLFFSFSARLDHYSFPLLPPLALLTGLALGAGREELAPSMRRAYGVLAALGGVLLAAVMAVVAWVGSGNGLFADNGFFQRNQARWGDFDALLAMPAEALSRLLWPLALFIAAIFVGFTLARAGHRRGSQLKPALALAAVMAVFHGAAAASLLVCQGWFSSRAFGEKLHELRPPGGVAVVAGDFESANSMNFYTSMPLRIIDGSAPSLAGGLRFPDAPQLLLSGPQLAALWHGPSPVFYLVDSLQAENLDLQPAYPVMHSFGRSLISNRPPPPR